MKKSLLFLASVFVGLFLTGCMGSNAQPYVDVTSSEYATLELTSVTDTNGIGESLTAYIEHSSCTDPKELGHVKAGINASSRVIKIPADKPLWIGVRYVYQILYDSASYGDNFVLTPEKGKHYVVKYFSKDISFTQALRGVNIYMLEDGKKIDVPSSRLHTYGPEDHCK